MAFSASPRNQRPYFQPQSSGMVNGSDSHMFPGYGHQNQARGHLGNFQQQPQIPQMKDVHGIQRPMIQQQTPSQMQPHTQMHPSMIQRPSLGPNFTQHQSTGIPSQILEKSMGNLQINSGQHNLPQGSRPGVPGMHPQQSNSPLPRVGMSGNYRSEQQMPLHQPAPRMSTSVYQPSIRPPGPVFHGGIPGTASSVPQQFPGMVNSMQGSPQPNMSSIGSSGSRMPGHAPGQPRGIRPHSQIPPTQTFQRPPMTNPGMTTMPSSPGLPTYPSPTAQPAMNLSGPMPPMAGANSQPNHNMPGYGPGPGHTRPMPSGGMGMNSSRRIDPDQIPSPIQVMKDDQNNFNDAAFNTSIRGRVPPLVTTKCVIRDDGNCSPQYIRSTLYNVPNNQDVLKASGVPFAVSLSPFAESLQDENPLQLVNHGVNGPVRCNRCKAYMNPFMQFIDGGRRFVCNICNYSSEVPQEYFSHLDHQGLRVDMYQRPELCLGSYEFLATTDYCKNQKPTQPPAYIFMIEASYQSIQSGMLRILVREIPALLERLPKEPGQTSSSIKVGFVTYNSTLHFYNVKSNLAQPQMMIVSDVNDVFVPLLDGFLVDAKDSKTVIESLMEQISIMFAETRETEIVLAPVVQAGLDALQSAGISGKLLVFHTTLPVSEAPGKLKNREDRKLLSSDKEKTILCPQTNFYEKLAKSCVESGVAIDLFLFPNSYIDVATIGALTSITGGQLYRYSYFKESTHGEQFLQDLIENIERNVGLDTIMRLRTSAGLRPCEFYGNFNMNNTTDVELALVNSRTSIIIEIKHDDKLAEDSVAYLQCALLYTSVGGQRRLRIHNLALSTCSQLTDLFRCCEMDTFANYVAKRAIKEVTTSVPKTIRENIVNQAASVLACYRQNCAAPSSAGQLILPECMKLLPLYTNSILKSDALIGGSEMSSDDRSWLMQTVLGMDISSTVAYFYPRLIPVHDVNVNDTNIPPQIRCSEERMKENGVYLLENGIILFLWIGLHVSPEWLQQVFAVGTIGHVDIEMTSLPDVDTPMSRRLRGIVAEIHNERNRYMKISIVRQRDKMEPWFKHYLVEDKGLSASCQSYVDFLCVMHKEVRNLLN
ncbi:protein transport protein Sec24D-like isoform X2 [Xenia sp. Carnegie-2017]|uniref:protein transport protein Sec24D-like isoform X2 n=1 Tax=Xenia sp. Carnegie-2017 TaxID=2897299 RepID=UPI001F03CCCF|nr:protein transport protein Sec24D-like isoform X2 [Xenia sp. Carnegie-2017]